mgnify:CR=1 FL=1
MTGAFRKCLRQVFRNTITRPTVPHILVDFIAYPVENGEAVAMLPPDTLESPQKRLRIGVNAPLICSAVLSSSAFISAKAYSVLIGL